MARSHLQSTRTSVNPEDEASVRPEPVRLSRVPPPARQEDESGQRRQQQQQQQLQQQQRRDWLQGRAYGTAAAAVVVQVPGLPVANGLPALLPQNLITIL